MTIEQTASIDFASIDSDSGKIMLTISDHLLWNGDQGIHVQLLQDKLNSYLRFVESGEIRKKIPGSQGREVAINVVGKFDLSDQAKLFYDRATQAITNAGIEFKFSLMRPN
jgi:hypothetical protein